MLGYFGIVTPTNHDSRVRENSEVVIICPDSYGKSPFLVVNQRTKWAMVNSYVSLLEDIYKDMVINRK
jgi:hypothetical protein